MKRRKPSWEKSFADSQKELALLAEEALKEFEEGNTKKLDEILAQFEANPNIGESWETVKRRIRASKK